MSNQRREWIATVSNAGHLPGKDRLAINDLLGSLRGKTVKITIETVSKKRSSNQNSFYHGPFIEVFRQHLLECGHRLSHDDIHSGLKDAHAKNAYTLLLPGGVEFKVPPSTARLSTMDFEGFLEEIRAEYAARFSWQLPFPNETPSF